MSIRDKLKEIIKELIRQELEEVSVTGSIDGGEGPPKTPYAFSSGKKKDKEKEKKNNIDEKKLFDTSSKSAKPKSQGKKKP